MHQRCNRETRLKAIFNLGAGINGLLAEPNLPATLTIVRLEDAGMAVQMAEYVLHQVLESSRSMKVYREQRRNGVWQIHRPIQRRDWPISVMGLGHIGKRVARTLANLDCPVNGWPRSKHTLDGIDTWAGRSSFGNFLKQTRGLVNTLPLTDETRDVINYEALSQLKLGAILINVGRGECWVDDDLIKTLDNGHLASRCPRRILSGPTKK